MYLSLSVSWWLTIPLAILNGGLLVRVFIIFHDCTHGSFFKSRKANEICGFITGIFTFTSFHHWKWEHSVHHATSGDLDRRGMGDVWTMTVDEYLKSSRLDRFRYQIARNPIILFSLAPLYYFLLKQRLPHPKAKAKEKLSIWSVNLCIALISAGLIYSFGFIPWLIIQLTVSMVAYSSGVWLFYIQHQFEDTYWENNKEWDMNTAAIKGSSYYKLPKILQWFSGNIGYHHIHHLNSKVPNYNLESCHEADPGFNEATTITLFESLKSLKLHLWDESSGKLISFGQLRKQAG